MTTVFRKLALASVMATSAIFPASARTYVAVIWGTDSVNYFASPDDPFQGKSYLGQTESGMHLCAAYRPIIYRNSRYAQFFLPNGRAIYMSWTDAAGSFTLDPANDKKCEAHAAQYAQASGLPVQNAAGGSQRNAQSSAPTAPSTLPTQSTIAGTLEAARVAEERGDSKTASLLLGPLAEQGNMEAQLEFAMLVKAVLRCQTSVSLYWFRKAADQGSPEAQYQIGVAYLTNEHYNCASAGISQDYTEAAKWFRKAADQGYAKAQYVLGHMYEEGEGVPQDYAEAMKWYRKPAEEGLKGAQEALTRASGFAEQESERRRKMLQSKSIGDTVCDFSGNIYGQVDDIRGKKMRILHSGNQQPTWINYNDVYVCEN